MREYKIVAINSILDPRGVIGNICYEKKIQMLPTQKTDPQNSDPPQQIAVSSSMSTNTYHGLIASAKTYCGDSNLTETVHWQSLGRDGADMLVDSDGKLVTLTITGAVINDKLITGPLSNFQSQEDNFSRSDNKMRCDQAKLVIVIGTPSQSDHPEWAQDFETAMKNLKEIQETVAKSKPNTPCLHFLDLKTGNV